MKFKIAFFQVILIIFEYVFIFFVFKSFIKSLIHLEILVFLFFWSLYDVVDTLLINYSTESISFFKFIKKFISSISFLFSIWIFVGMVITIYEYLNFSGKNPLSGICKVGGYLSFFAGAIIRIIAIRTLKKYFIVDINPPKGSTLLTWGIYKYIRHPGYLGSILMLVAFPVFFCSIYGFFYFLIGSLIYFLYRISKEEKKLIKVFGDNYLRYKEKTKKLVPWIF